MKGLMFVLFTFSFLTILSAQNNHFPKIDRYALKAPKLIEQDINTLADYLAKETYSELEVVRSFYTWITHHITYDDKAAKNLDDVSQKSIPIILKNKKAICSEYAYLFKTLCDLKSIKSFVVSGYSKGTLTASPKMEAPDHAWNVVQIDSTWYLLDATWGSNAVAGQSDFSIQYNTDYFLTDPKLLILNHLPADPMWQLLDNPITTNTFQWSADDITTTLEKEQTPLFNYKDSIQQLLSLQPIEQVIKRATNEYNFNPTSQLSREYGHALLDYEAYLSDLATSLQGTTHLDSLLRLQEQTIALCEKAAKYATLYPHQKENCTYNRFNYAIALYQSINDKTGENEKEKIIKEVILHLEQSEKELQQLPANFMTEQAIGQCKEYIDYLKN